MPTFIYRCPNTGFRVQGYEPGTTESDSAYEPVVCTMCKQVHLVNFKTGKVLGDGDSTDD
jgi:hypothetical protein